MPIGARAGREVVSGALLQLQGSRRLYQAAAHFSVITPQQKHAENVAANSAALKKRDETPLRCFLSASRNSCLRLNVIINVGTRALCFASKYGARARREDFNQV